MSLAPITARDHIVNQFLIGANNNLFYSNIGTSDGDLVQGVVTLIGTGVVT